MDLHDRAGSGTSTAAALRVAAVVVPGRAGRRVLRRIRSLAGRRPIEVTLVALAPHVRGRGCAVSPAPLNEAIDEAARADLDRAARELELDIPVRGSFMLRGGIDPPLDEWLAEREIELVITASRRTPARRAATARY